MFAKLIRPKSDMSWPEGKVFSQTKICLTRSRLYQKMAKIGLSRIKSSAFKISSYAGPSVLGSICLQGCLGIDIKVWKCPHIGNFHLQSVEVFKMHFPWLIVCGLMCECTEGCCQVCTECRVSVEVIDHT